MKRNNKILAVILSLVMVLSVAMIAHAAETEGVGDYLEMTVAKDGDTVTLTIKAKKAIESLGAFETASNGVSYDDSVFTFVSCTGGTSDIDAEFDEDTKKLLAFATGDDVEAGGTLVTLTFTAGADFDEEKDYAFSVTFNLFGDADAQTYGWFDGAALTATLEGQEEQTSSEEEQTSSEEEQTSSEEEQTSSEEEQTSSEEEQTSSEADTTAEEEEPTAASSEENTAAETETQSTTAAAESSENTTPDTGDHSNLTLWYIMALAGAAGLIVLFAGSKKRETE